MMNYANNHTIEYYRAIKKSKLPIYPTIGMNLTDKVSERSQTLKTFHYLSEAKNQVKLICAVRSQTPD